ncbi:LOW QUALITY PROTEIN: uncharacterized protein LOC117568754 [Drosophila albomicans]|uniref:X-box-binding protein 1 n=1 Tax=Drosophila albomicans TaxID=7291 RepID=A0A6P8WP37_DROAB|nr:LOW QUALITY PROTEIN: uncharacterized protein LOC117568754 [Drosophila albomicans]
MAPANGVLLTKCVPLGSTLNLNILPKLRPAPITAVLLKGSSSPSSSGYASSSNNSVADEDTMASNPTAPVKAKKRRLDHLSWEEKVQRKKLKNRVAAQTSRDRKKARMEEMEYEIKELNEKTEILQNKCESLQSINESLMAKNHKLDTEVELLRQELAEMKEIAKNNNTTKSHGNSECDTNAGAEGCASTNTGSAASNADSAAGYTSGHTVVSACFGADNVAPGAEAEQQLNGLALENCGALSSIQDMLLVDDEEFDARRLEELAESLLADITAELETSGGQCDPPAPKEASEPERLPGSVVGTTAECMESGGDRVNGLNSEEKATTTIENSSPSVQQMSHINGNLQKKTTTKATTPTTISAATFLQSATPDTVYGTYDAKTNSITIVMDGDAVPVNEAVEVIYGEGVSAGDDTTDVIMKCPQPATSPSQVYLNVINATEDSDDETMSHLNFEPINRFLCPRVKAISPLAKSPAQSMHSATSDHGYESVLGSPTSTTLANLDTDDDFPWESNFDELFPSLI